MRGTIFDEVRIQRKKIKAKGCYKGASNLLTYPIFCCDGGYNKNHETLHFGSPIELDVMIHMTMGWKSY